MGVLCAIFILTTAHSQVANNNFAQAVDVYTPINAVSGPINTLWSNNFDDAVSGAINLPNPFEFDGNAYNQIWISSNGFITFGSAPSATNYTPLSSAETYAGAIVPFGFDLESAQSAVGGPREVIWKISGNEVQIEWKRVRRKGLDEAFTFQLRLNTNSPGDGIRQIYGPIESANAPGPATSETAFPQVGLRGPDNNHSSNVKNRRVTVNGNNNWNNSIPGNNNTSVCRFTGGPDARYWTVGQSYYFNGIWDCTIGVECNDGDPCTIDDLTYANCHCVGTYEDTDGDLVCDFFDDCPDLASAIGSPCDDSDVCTEFDQITSDCECVGTYLDSDNDGTCNGSDGCPNDPNKTAPGICGCGVSDAILTWYLDTDGDGFGDPATEYQSPVCFQIIGSVSVAGDCNDSDPALTAVGQPCDDGNPATVGDLVNASCVCAGFSECAPSPSLTDPCTENISVYLTTDLEANEITWSIQDPLNSSIVFCSGGPYQPGFLLNLQANCCLPEGCYVFALEDSGSDGMLSGNNGGYTMRTAVPDDRRIIDNDANGDFGSLSRIGGTQCYSFCVPVGADRLIYTSCDKYWWKTGEYMVANANPLVTAEWVPNGANNVQPGNSGYEFWFYNPNGGYSFRKFRPHNVSDNFAPASAYRACHIKINNWNAAFHVPQNQLMNVKVRGRVQGVNEPWGPACRFVRDEVLALCPPTKLMDIPGNQFLSCNQFRQFIPTQRVHARPISGATQYQWRFRIVAEGIEIIRTSSTYFLNLGWGAGVAPPLEDTKTYEVDVRAFKNGQWCGTGDPWGDVCSLTIGVPFQGGGVQSTLETPGPEMTIWPNPSNGRDLRIELSGFPSEEMTMTYDVFDLTGKLIHTGSVTLLDGEYNGPLQVGSYSGSGFYLIKARVGDLNRTERILLRQ